MSSVQLPSLPSISTPLTLILEPTELWKWNFTWLQSPASATPDQDRYATATAASARLRIRTSDSFELISATLLVGQEKPFRRAACLPDPGPAPFATIVPSVRERPSLS